MFLGHRHGNGRERLRGIKRPNSEDTTPVNISVPQTAAPATSSIHPDKVLTEPVLRTVRPQGTHGASAHS